MRPLHIAIFIFVVGVSVVNFFHAKRQYDRYYIDPSKLVLVTTGPETNTVHPKSAEKLYREGQERLAWDMSHRNIENVYDTAYMWEAAILTVGGIAYVLVSRRPVEN